MAGNYSDDLSRRASPQEDVQNMTAAFEPIPAETESILIGVRTVSLIYLVVSLFLWGWDVFTGCHGKKSWVLRRNINSASWRLFVMRLLVFAQTTMNIAVFTLVTVMVWYVPYVAGVGSCTLMAQFATVLYASSVQLVLFTLIIRCGFVEGLIQTKMYKFISLSTRITLAVFVPLVFFTSVKFFADGYVTSSGICLLVNTAPTVFAIIFLVGTGGMTLVMMYLFVAPIRKSIEAVNPSNASVLRSTLYRNVALNMIAMATQIVCSTFFWTLNLGPNIPGWQNGADLTLSLIFPCTDIMLLGICARLMVGEGGSGSHSRTHHAADGDGPRLDPGEASTLPTPDTVRATNTMTMALG